MSLPEIRRIYKVPATRGRLVRVNGEWGVIVGAKGHYVRVRFAGNKHAMNCHPMWEFDYSPQIPPTPTAPPHAEGSNVAAEGGE